MHQELIDQCGQVFDGDPADLVDRCSLADLEKMLRKVHAWWPDELCQLMYFVYRHRVARALSGASTDAMLGELYEHLRKVTLPGMELPEVYIVRFRTLADVVDAQLEINNSRRLERESRIDTDRDPNGYACPHDYVSCEQCLACGAWQENF